MGELQQNSVDAVVTDPPYGLAFMGRTWDDFEPKEYQEFSEEWGEEALRVLKPGGYLIAFSGTRTYHRMVSGLEDAGFEIRDQICWMYGDGFPKGQDISKEIERKTGDGGKADRWDGWNTALKPAHEPIVVARKPKEGTFAENVLEWDVGGLNVDACRIPAPDGGWTWGTQTDITGGGYGSNRPSEGDVLEKNISGGEDGRWPPNVVLDSSASAMLDAQTGERPSGGPIIDAPSNPAKNTYGEWTRDNWSGYDDSGGASRFFYHAKARKRERNAGLEGLESRNLGQSNQAAAAINRGDEVPNSNVGLNETTSAQNDIETLKPINLMRWLVRLVTPEDGKVLDPFAGSGTTGCASEVEGFDYTLIEERERFAEEIAPRRCEYWSNPENWDDLKEHSELDRLEKMRNSSLENYLKSS